MYKHYFHFDKLPFSIVPDPEFLYFSPRHKEGLAHLLYGVTKSDGFVTLTGEIGTGKTTLCRSLLEQIPDNIDIAIILNPKLCAVELLATICDELGISYDRDDQNLKALTDLLNEHLLATHAMSKRTVLLIDEAQNLSDEVLEQIRLLTNLETTKTKLLQIVLVGQPELRLKLNQYKLRQLNQRITARYHLDPLTQAETSYYIQHRLSVSGGYSGLFTNRAIGKVFKLSKGVPRLINLLCDRALLGAYSTGKTRINPGVVSKAATEVLPDSPFNFPFQRASVVLVILLMCIAAIDYFYDYRFQWPDKEELVVKARDSSQSEMAEKIWSEMSLLESSATSDVKKEGIQPASSIKMDSAEDSSSKSVFSMVKKRNMQKEKQKSFFEFITRQETTMNRALRELLDSWGINAPSGHSLDCNDVQGAGLRCFIDEGSWHALQAYNRPVILEFLSDEKIKHYALLVGVKNGQPVFRFNGDYSFPVKEVLSYWQGYFLMLWRPPYNEKKNIHPQQSSDNVLWLRQNLEAIYQGVVPDKQPEFFDETLKKQIVHFQKEHQIDMDGVVGPQTIIHLQNYAKEINFPTLQAIR